LKRSQKRRSKHILRTLKLLFAGAFIAIALFLYVNQLNQALFVMNRHQTEIDELKKKYNLLHEERLKYEEAIGKLKKDEYIEMAARKQFKMVKPGEKPYIVIFKDSSQTSEQSLLDLLTQR
jgi:cell division protein FtsB